MLYKWKYVQHTKKKIIHNHKKKNTRPAFVSNPVSETTDVNNWNRINSNHTPNSTEFPDTHWYILWPYVENWYKNSLTLYTCFTYTAYEKNPKFAHKKNPFCKKIAILTIFLFPDLYYSLTCASNVRNPKKHQSLTTQNSHIIPSTWT